MKTRVILFISVSSFLLTSCTVSPCSCANAQLNNDKEMIKKCNEKRDKMTEEEQYKWNMEIVSCLGV